MVQQFNTQLILCNLDDNYEGNDWKEQVDANVNVWRKNKPNINQQQAPEHEMVLSTQAADAIPASARVSRDENGSEESNDEDDSEDEDNDNVNPVNDRNIYVPET